MHIHRPQSILCCYLFSVLMECSENHSTIEAQFKRIFDALNEFEKKTGRKIILWDGGSHIIFAVALHMLTKVTCNGSRSKGHYLQNLGHTALVRGALSIEATYRPWTKADVFPAR